MRIGTRLYLAILPGVLGILLVVALGYWGHYYRAIPRLLLTVAVIAAILSFVMAWQNTRYVARRVQRLAQGRAARVQAADELIEIEQVVDTLSDQVVVARRETVREQQASSERVREYSALLAETSAGVARRLEEVRLPLHILLDNHFGELNENQEEMLGAARAAVESAEEDLRRLREIAELDRGALAMRRDAIRPGELLTSLEPTLRARAAREGVRLAMDVAPGLPRIVGDQTRLREALGLLIGHRIEHSPPDETVRVQVEQEDGVVTVKIEHGAIPPASAEDLLARRLVEAHGGSIDTSGGQTEIRLPAQRPTTNARS